MKPDFHYQDGDHPRDFAWEANLKRMRDTYGFPGLNACKLALYCDWRQDLAGWQEGGEPVPWELKMEQAEQEMGVAFHSFNNREVRVHLQDRGFLEVRRSQGGRGRGSTVVWRLLWEPVPFTNFFVRDPDENAKQQQFTLL